MRSIHRVTEEIAELRRIAAGGAPSVHHGPVPVRRAPSRSRSISAAISWLVTHLIAGFAAYGEAMYPCLVRPEEGADLQRGTLDTRSTHEQRRDRVVPGPLSSRPWPNEDEARSPALTASGSRDQGAFRLARLLWRRRTGRVENVPAASLERLDDRMLRDIGLHRDEIEGFAWHMNPWEW